MKTLTLRVKDCLRVGATIGLLLLPVYLQAGEVRWNPHAIETVLWLDASDASTITESSGAVSQWADKSGTDNHAIAEVGNEPTTDSRTLNGMNVLEFDGSDVGGNPGDELGLTQNVSFESNLVFMVLQTDTPAAHANGFSLFGRKGSDQKEPMFFNNPNGSFTMWGANDTFYKWNDTATSTLTRGTTGIVCVVGAPGTDADLVINGTVESAAFGMRGVGEDPGTRSDFGAIASTKNFEPREVDGVIAEVIVVPDVSTTTRQKVEGYLAWKWGLEAELPNGHPYEDAAPTMSSWTAADINTLLWLDASDTTTITESSGAVSQWDDKSGNANHAIAVAANKPTTDSRALSGLNVLEFDGSDVGGTPGDELGLTRNVSIENNLVFMVLQADASPAHANGFSLIGRKGSDQKEPMFFYNPNGSFTMWGATDTFYKWNDTATSTLTRGDSGIICVIGNPGADADLVINGTVESAAFGMRGVGEDPGTRSDFGAIASTRNFEPREVDGVIAEVIVVPDVSDATRQKIEGYLAWKWGLVGNLSDGHPYESAPPSPEFVSSYKIDINVAGDNVTSNGWRALNAVLGTGEGSVDIGGVTFSVTNATGARLRGTVGSPTPDALNGDFVYKAGHGGTMGIVLGEAGDFPSGDWIIDIYSYDSSFAVGPQIVLYTVDAVEHVVSTNVAEKESGPAVSFRMYSDGSSAYTILLREDVSVNDRLRLNGIHIYRPSGTVFKFR